MVSTYKICRDSLQCMYNICKMGSTNTVKELLNKSIGFDPDPPSKKHP